MVYCQLEALRHCLPSSVGGTLDELPKTLDETYERILRGGFNEANREHAHRLLQCLAVAVRPLLVEELAEVLAVDFDAARGREIPKLNPNWRSADQHRAVLSTCSSLITIVEQGNFKVVQFSHLSVKKFLVSDRLARSSGDVSLLEAPAILPGVQPDPAALVEDAIAESSVLIFGQRPGSLSGRRPRGKPTVPEQASLFGFS